MPKDTLRKIDMFNALDNEEFKTLSDATTFKTLNKDNILFYEGDKAEYLYMLLDGELKLYKQGAKSQEIVLHHFNKPSLIAEMPTLENLNFPATCIALRDETLVGMIEKDSFKDILNKNPKLSLHIIMSLTKKIKNLETSINRNMVFDATAKVCSILKENPEVLQTKKHIQVANFLNIAPETLSRSIAKLKKLKVLNSNNEVTDIDRLDIFLD